MINIDELMSTLENAMIITVKKPWGLERVITFETEQGIAYLKHIIVNEGQRTSRQSHTTGREVVFILKGSGTVEGTNDVNDDRLRPSRPYPIPSGLVHRSVGPVELLELTTAGPMDIIRYEDDYRREGTVGA